ncbi:hypothetical protein SELMODRAFT_406403 [Selaginella moellendorffii]|uniref:Uncharacterized protein n=1 Tax=Selaginella moellendorffii TaxID=88036 RepID=D8R289_SELML|nr:uncharacterized protein LOC9658824 [Selaginella moellendorffii]EFJ33684.1 hypothetical protein SELMODRAFT_406403 [Selaginella moellendorffii]|eukprot:XP_002964846.1 uncharacterized protein LOC9658824 [Selaginella moellendorffii]
MALTAAPKFFTIESAAYPGYCITQQGNQVVLKSKDALNPFQLWYRDESWNLLNQEFSDRDEFLDQDISHLSAFVFVNHGSKKALRSQAYSTSQSKATIGDYDPAGQDNYLLWRISGSHENQVLITMTVNKSSFLSHTSSSASFKDGVPVVTSNSNGNSHWKLVTYKPSQEYRILCHWFGQYLTWKQQNVDVTFKNAVKHNDETNVVAISPNNVPLDSMTWYKVPAGGRDDTTYFTSFVLINKVTGLALKGSAKPGDKVLLTQYDPLNYSFVWSENRFQASNTDYLAINLDGTTLQWALQNDDQYQNSAWYHPLVLRSASPNQGYLEQQAWKFNPVVAGN